MIAAKLIRFQQDEECTRGVLTVEDRFVCMTLELPWKENQQNVSCIPEADHYLCKRGQSPHFGGAFEVIDVPGRDHILFHTGNTPADSEGCILVGRTLEPNLCFIRDSRLARTTLMNALNGVDEFHLTIVGVNHGTS